MVVEVEPVLLNLIIRHIVVTSGLMKTSGRVSPPIGIHEIEDRGGNGGGGGGITATESGVAIGLGVKVCLWPSGVSLTCENFK